MAGWRAAGGSLSVVGTTRWPSGTCSVELVLHDLVDHAARTPALALTYGFDGPVDGQPLAFTLAYLLADALLAGLRRIAPEGVDPLWVVTPRDITRLSIEVTCAGTTVTSVPLVHLGPMQVQAGTSEPLALAELPLQPEPHWELCRRQAIGYLALGATREARLWLAMSAERLLDDRVAIAIAAKPELAERLTATRLLYAEAEQTVATQFPDLAGRVVWPDKEVQPSRWALLKGLYRHASMRGTHQEAAAAYAAATKGRNPLVHGSDDQLPPADEIAAGLAALDWLAEHLTAMPTPAPGPGQHPSP